VTTVKIKQKKKAVVAYKPPQLPVTYFKLLMICFNKQLSELFKF